MNPFLFRFLSFSLLLSSVLGGCRSVQSSPERAAGSIKSTPRASHDSSPTLSDAQSPSRWPSRWGNNPDHRGTIIELDPADPLRPIHLSRYHQSRSTEIEYADANQLAADIGITTGFKFKAEGPGSFLFIPNPKNKSHLDLSHNLTKDSGKQSKSDIPDLAFKFVSAKIVENSAKELPKISDPLDPYVFKFVSNDPNYVPPPKPKQFGPPEDHVELQRTWFTYRDPKAKSEPADPLGTIILLPGMFGTPDPIVDALENYWHHKHYAILRMRSHPSRFTEHYEFSTQPGMAVMYAGEVARMNDDRVAEGAYATKAALDYVLSKRPTLADKPVILVGMSGGAMMLPTVYAYAPDSYAAAVIIAGGANFLEISLDSNYKSWIDAITYDFDPDPNKLGKIVGENRKNFLGDYLKKSKLDAYHTATEMGDIPVLMLHASVDQAVPASTGELLYQQLGQPERWSYPVGHELIFIGLPTQVTRIDRWITKELGNSQ